MSRHIIKCDNRQKMKYVDFAENIFTAYNIVFAGIFEKTRIPFIINNT